MERLHSQLLFQRLGRARVRTTVRTLIERNGRECLAAFYL